MADVITVCMSVHVVRAIRHVIKIVKRERVQAYPASNISQEQSKISIIQHFEFSCDSAGQEQIQREAKLSSVINNFNQFQPVVGWDGMGWVGMGWDGMGWDEMGWDGMGCDVM